LIFKHILLDVTRNTRLLPINIYLFITDDYGLSSTVYSVLEGSKWVSISLSRNHLHHTFNHN